MTNLGTTATALGILPNSDGLPSNSIVITITAAMLEGVNGPKTDLTITLTAADLACEIPHGVATTAASDFTAANYAAGANYVPAAADFMTQQVTVPIAAGLSGVTSLGIRIMKPDGTTTYPGSSTSATVQDCRTPSGLAYSPSRIYPGYAGTVTLSGLTGTVSVGLVATAATDCSSVGTASQLAFTSASVSVTTAAAAAAGTYKTCVQSSNSCSANFAGASISASAALTVVSPTVTPDVVPPTAAFRMVAAGAIIGDKFVFSASSTCAVQGTDAAVILTVDGEFDTPASLTTTTYVCYQTKEMVAAGATTYKQIKALNIATKELTMAITFTGVPFSDLTTDAAKTALANAIATKLVQDLGLTPGSVRVVLRSGSIIADVTIVAPAASLTAVETQLADSTQKSTLLAAVQTVTAAELQTVTGNTYTLTTTATAPVEVTLTPGTAVSTGTTAGTGTTTTSGTTTTGTTTTGTTTTGTTTSGTTTTTTATTTGATTTTTASTTTGTTDTPVLSAGSAASPVAILTMAAAMIVTFGSNSWF
jgi:mucin-2